MTDRKKNVLFLCTGNSCRSQMGEGWAKALLPDTVNAYSAGTAPKGLDPEAIAVMAEAGIDISGGKSQTIDDLADVQFDLVPHLPRKRTCGASALRRSARHRQGCLHPATGA
jgi:arsenate reductase